MSRDTTTHGPLSDLDLAVDPGGGALPERSGLVVLWSRDEPERVGEIAFVPERQRTTWTIGREAAGRDRLGFARQRPGRSQETGQLRARRVSRDHLLISLDGDQLCFRNGGRLQVKVNDQTVPDARLAVGDTVEIDHELLLLVVRRPGKRPALGGPLHPFGEADRDGVVGESPAIWELRRQLRFCAAAGGHVLVSGPSGAGKELVAQAIHRLSKGGGALVSRNAATFPEGILDAELFGNLRDYPNPGMAERAGVVGEADGGTLFLDEIGETSHAMQAHLLRVLDEGEYQRLGEGRRRTSRFRLIGATNRPIEVLKRDFLARMTRRIEVPGLDARLEDIPLLAARLLSQITADNPDLFPDGAPLLHPQLVRSLLLQPYATHVRELSRLLWTALDAWSAAGGGRYLKPAPGEIGASPTPQRLGDEPTREEILAAYRRFGGVQARVPEAVGLRDRYQLARLEKKLGITRADRDAAVAGG